MDAYDPRWAEIARIQEQLMRGLEELSRVTPGSLGLDQCIPPKDSHTSSLGLDQVADDRVARYQIGAFGPDSGLTPAQAAEANRLLARANHLRPIRGRNARERYARRIGGIKVAVLSGRTGNTSWGRSMLGKRGGKVMALYGLHILRAIAPRGAEAAKAARALKKATTHFEKTGQVLVLEQSETDERGQLQPLLDAWQDERPFMLW